MKSIEIIRDCAVSGLFYPEEPAVLRENVASMITRAARPVGAVSVRGIVSPHAGYQYSGQTAAAAFARLQGGNYDVVVIVSPSHREFFDGVSVYSGDAYRTPLGKLPVHTLLRKRLVETCPIVRASEAGHREEHAIEVQLPFLQHVLGDVTVLPLVIGNQRRDRCLKLGEALGRLLREERALLVASTDLSHYHPSTEADRLDRVFMDDVERFDFEQLMSDLERGTTEACGGGPVVAVMKALHDLGVRRIEVVQHTNSGDVTGDRGSVVGYLSAVAYA